MAVFLAGVGVAPAADNSAAQLRQFIDQQVGGIRTLTVPATDAAIPLPTPPVGQTAYRYETTEAKRYLGKLLFHDPVRTARIDTNFGGMRATAQTGSCGSCHLGEASGKAGAQFNFNVGAEGRGYTDEKGNFVARRRPRTDLLARLRNTPLFPGDSLVDSLPTLTDVLSVPNPTCGTGALTVTTPARANKTPAPCQLLATGRLDALDSVGRQSPSMVGFAFNNRLLLGGFAGESNSLAGGLNPLNDPAQENLTLLLLDAHRMLTDAPTPGEMVAGQATLNGQSPVLQKIPAFVKLFKDAFPQEAAAYAKSGNLNDLINDETVLRATSTFLRTVVTRNTPFDRFLAGDNRALTAKQRRGAKLFFTPAANGAGGAGCFVCHSGPMLNKQYNDPDLTGVGKFVEENFVNVGIGDHPLQALNRAATQFPDQARHDVGRQEITGDPKAAFKFRVLTLRQLKEAFTFFHDGAPRFANVRDTVEYFNTGLPEDPTFAGAASTLDARFTNPRGPGYPIGLGLTTSQVNDLSEFLENGLYDPALSHYDPQSSTRLMELDREELAYTKNRPDLAALGAKDGLVLSGLAMNNNDPLTRRDEGFEFLDVTGRVGTALTRSQRDAQMQTDVVRLTNTGSALANFGAAQIPGIIDSGSVIDTHLLIVVKGLRQGIRLTNASGTTSGGDPYIRVFLREGVLIAGQSISESLLFQLPPNSAPATYTLAFLSGQGKP